MELQWFWPYLSGRKQYVSVACNLFETLEIFMWSQTGICAWTITFLQYINELPKISDKLTFFCFLMTQIFITSHLAYLIFKNL